jgi:hypothetical protein
MKNRVSFFARSNPPSDDATPINRNSINLLVRDQKGQPIQQADFTAFDNDEPQNLLTFRAAAVRDAPGIYKLTLEVAHADHADEYHEIAVRVDRPNLDVHMIRGYYATSASIFSIGGTSVAPNS